MRREGNRPRFVPFPVDIWGDGWFLSLPPDGKTLYLYLITCPSFNPSGLFNVSTQEIVVSTFIPPEQVRVAFLSLEPEVSYFPSRKLVWVKNIVRIRKDLRDNPLYWEWAVRFVFSSSIPGDIREEWLFCNEHYLRRAGFRVRSSGSSPVDL